MVCALQLFQADHENPAFETLIYSLMHLYTRTLFLNRSSQRSRDRKHFDMDGSFFAFVYMFK